MKAPAHTLDDGFDRFWVVYPRHVGKKDAQKAWTALHPVPDLIDRILAAVAWQKTTPQWLKDGGVFIPYAGSWLRGERWEDEPFDTRSLVSDRTRQNMANSEAAIRLIEEQAHGRRR